MQLVFKDRKDNSGIQGIQGERGIGISKLEVKEGFLYVTLTDSTTQNAGLIITDDVKQWIVNQVTDNAKSNFNTYYEGKVEEFDEHAAELAAKVEQVQAENESLKAENKLIKEQIPGANVSGNNIHIEDSGTLDFDWKIKGGHKQATREGYNLIDLTSLIGKTETKNGITYKINEDCSITVNGIPTEYTSFWLRDISLKAGTYKFVDGINSNNVFLQTLGDFNDTSQNRTFSLSEDGDGTLYLVIDIGAPTLNNVTLYPMIYSGTEDKPYEQYGASPSPGYLSEIETVGSNVNILNYNNLTTAAQNAGYAIDESGNVYHQEQVGDTRSWSYSNSNYMLELSKGSYMLSIYFSKLTSNNNSQIVIYKEDSTSIKITKLNNISNIKIEFNLQETQKIGLMIKTFEGVYKIKLEKGSIAKPYSPYGMGSVEIDVVNDNLLDMSNAVGGTDHGITCVVNANGSFSYVGTATGIAVNIWLLGNWNRKDVLFKLEPGTYYIDGVQLFYINTSVANAYDKKIFTFTETQLITGVRTLQAEVGKSYNEIIYPIIALSDKTVEWTQHQSQTAIMPIQQEMLEGDYVTDVEHHEWGKIVLTGEENWREITTNNLKRFFCEGNVTSINNNSTVNCISNYFKSVSRNKLESSSGDEISVADKFLNILSKKVETKEDFKAWLKSKYDEGNPVIVYYKLATPLDLELTSEQQAVRDTKLYTYKKITNISASDELASIDVEYKKDPTTEHDDLQNQIDEIKQLLSTTQTSALLLDNLQKDVESEVE